MELIPIDQAAELAGVTPADLTMSFQRGLWPGNTAVGIDGALWFDPARLTPPPRADRPRLTAKETLQAEARILGVPFTSKTTVAELEKLLAEAAVEEE